MTDDEAVAAQRKQAADDLFQVLEAIDAVDLNHLQDEDIRTLLDVRDCVMDMTAQYRTEQHREGSQ